MPSLTSLRSRSKRAKERDSFREEDAAPSFVVLKVRNEGKLARPADWSSEAELERLGDDELPSALKRESAGPQLEPTTCKDEENSRGVVRHGSRNIHQCSCDVDSCAPGPSSLRRQKTVPMLDTSNVTLLQDVMSEPESRPAARSNEAGELVLPPPSLTPDFAPLPLFEDMKSTTEQDRERGRRVVRTLLGRFSWKRRDRCRPQSEPPISPKSNMQEPGVIQSNITAMVPCKSSQEASQSSRDLANTNHDSQQANADNVPTMPVDGNQTRTLPGTPQPLGEPCPGITQSYHTGCPRRVTSHTADPAPCYGTKSGKRLAKAAGVEKLSKKKKTVSGGHVRLGRESVRSEERAEDVQVELFKGTWMNRDSFVPVER